MLVIGREVATNFSRTFAGFIIIALGPGGAIEPRGYDAAVPQESGDSDRSDELLVIAR